jgi:phosphoribosylaminoimidazole-succinocarboxamide synthase
MINKSTIVIDAELPLPLFISGKVRNIYDLGNNLLIVASDRISAFDVVLPCGIPGKGQVLNELSAFWFSKTADIITNHFIEVVDDIRCLDYYLPEEMHFNYPKWLEKRSMVVKKVKKIPVECVVRGYISGSAWVEYRQHGTVNNMSMPEGLRQSQELAEPIFTPTTKGEGEHDLPMSKEEVIAITGEKTSHELKEKSIAIYNFARKYAFERGIIIADTKFEFGFDGDKLILIDEALTPDSSRFWDISLYKVGQPQDSYDKQPVRDWLENTGWNKKPPAPMLPPEVIESTSRRYRTAYERLTSPRDTS